MKISLSDRRRSPQFTMVGEGMNGFTPRTASLSLCKPIPSFPPSKSVNYVLAQIVNHLSLDMISAPTHPLASPAATLSVGVADSSPKGRAEPAYGGWGDTCTISAKEKSDQLRCCPQRSQ